MPIEEIFVRFRTNLNEFNKAMQTPISRFKQVIDETGKLNKRFKETRTVGGRLATRFRFMTHGLRGFRMEMLSVMFGGQMLQRAMFGLLKPALQVTGAFEIWGIMLQTLFLPVALWLLEHIFLPLFNIFSTLPEPIKMVIGVFVTIIGVIGSILAVGGALILFIGGLIMAWGMLNAVFIASPIGWIVLAIMGAIIAIIALIAITVTIWKKWDQVWTWIKEHKALAAVIGFFFPLIAIITAVISIIKHLQKNWSIIWDKIKEKIKPFSNFFKRWVINPIESAWDWLIEKITAGWNKLKGIWEAVKSAPGKVWGGVKGALGGRQGGGYIPHTGLYKLHAGETVSPAGATNFMPNIVVNATSNVDIEMLKTQLSSAWSDDLARLSRR